MSLLNTDKLNWSEDFWSTKLQNSDTYVLQKLLTPKEQVISPRRL
jgi:hypothetical protein